MVSRQENGKMGFQAEKKMGFDTKKNGLVKWVFISLQI